MFKAYLINAEETKDRRFYVHSTQVPSFLGINTGLVPGEQLMGEIQPGLRPYYFPMRLERLFSSLVRSHRLVQTLSFAANISANA